MLALIVCAYGIVVSVHGARSGRAEFSLAGRRSVYALAGLLTVGMVVLEIAFVGNDFAFNAVADTSSRTTPLLYRLAALWSSQEGSLLLWAWLLSMWSSLVLFLTRKRLREVASYATAILLGFGGFFVGLMVFYANPFTTTSPVPAEGVGLDPLLRFPTMMIHPPMLYSGYTLCTIPLAFAMGALIARKVDGEWIAVVRRFALAAWLFLGIGILLGASLVVLGARLGGLLGLGRGRERLALAVADRHRVPALADDPGAPRDAEGVERLASRWPPGSWRSWAPSWCAAGSSTRSTPSGGRRSAFPSCC